jgi:hypothetical protein
MKNHPLPPAAPATGLIRLAEAARMAGISTDIFEAGVAKGSIPVAIIKPGCRVRYVRAAEFNAWLGADGHEI